MSITKLICLKVAMVFTDPQIATAFWGAVGGLITAIIRKRSSILEISFSLVLAAIFATWFTVPMLEYLGLPASAANGVSAVLGICSYEIVRGLANLQFSNIIQKFTRK